MGQEAAVTWNSNSSRNHSMEQRPQQSSEANGGVTTWFLDDGSPNGDRIMAHSWVQSKSCSERASAVNSLKPEALQVI